MSNYHLYRFIHKTIEEKNISPKEFILAIGIKKINKIDKAMQKLENNSLNPVLLQNKEVIAKALSVNIAEINIILQKDIQRKIKYKEQIEEYKKKGFTYGIKKYYGYYLKFDKSYYTISQAENDLLVVKLRSSL